MKTTTKLVYVLDTVLIGGYWLAITQPLPEFGMGIVGILWLLAIASNLLMLPIWTSIFIFSKSPFLDKLWDRRFCTVFARSPARLLYHTATDLFLWSLLWGQGHHNLVVVRGFAFAAEMLVINFANHRLRQGFSGPDRIRL